jgi:hypothetical protein
MNPLIMITGRLAITTRTACTIPDLTRTAILEVRKSDLDLSGRYVKKSGIADSVNSWRRVE